MIPRDLLTKLHDLVNAGKLPGLSEAKMLPGTELTFREPAGRCYLKEGNDPSLNAVTIIALETSLAEVARERGAWLVMYGPFDASKPGDPDPLMSPPGNWGYDTDPEGDDQPVLSPSRLTALVRCTIAAFEGVEL